MNSNSNDRYSRQMLFTSIGIKGQKIFANMVMKMHDPRQAKYLKPVSNLKVFFKTIPIILLFLLIISSLWIYGCTIIDTAGEYLYGKFSSEEEMDNIVEAAENFFDLIMEEDYKQAYKYISNSDRDFGSEQDFVDEFSDVTKIVGVDINWVEIKSNTALLGVDMIDSYDGEEKMYKDIEVSLVREEDGIWKVVFWK